MSIKIPDQTRIETLFILQLDGNRTANRTELDHSPSFSDASSSVSEWVDSESSSTTPETADLERPLVLTRLLGFLPWPKIKYKRIIGHQPDVFKSDYLREALNSLMKRSPAPKDFM
jgi:hypothetical protein